jgi:hydroxyacylglutathione hydrolase
MFFRSFFDEKLAHMSYLIGCQKTGEAIIVDPGRNLTPYFEVAKKEGFTISAATETHIHADYASGAKELAELFNVHLYLSDEGDKDWKYEFAKDVGATLIKEGDEFSIGGVYFKVMHTPGHTPESISILLTDKGGGAREPMGVFTGDFLFVGDVGRPDLLEKSAGSAGTAKVGAKDMFASLQKARNLSDDLQIWPAHGAGSACGKSLGAVPVSTIGYERKHNWAFQITDEDEFVDELLSSQPEPPTYFGVMKKLNKKGAEQKTGNMPRRLQSLSELKEMIDDHVYVLDTRKSPLFAYGHIKEAVNISIEKSFTNWAGWLVPYDKDLIVVVEEEKLDEVITALQSIGLDRTIAFINQKTIEQDVTLPMYKQVDVHEAYQAVKSSNTSNEAALIDVRNYSEWTDGHAPEAIHAFLGHIEDHLEDLPKDQPLYILCGSGVRSAIAVSVLQKHGFDRVVNVKGGFTAWVGAELPVTKDKS